ncbi:MAG TPA: response regulator [Bacteroidota bacterium]|nr:response regulator [Bacteroidota bacterium]
MAKRIKKHVLVVDDEKAWLKIISHFLKTKGYAVQTAASGAEAIASLAHFKPDLILSDVRMPDMNGFDLIHNFKQIPTTSLTPIILFSAIDDFDARRTAKQLGATDYVVKPFNEEEMNSVMSRFIQPNTSSAPPSIKS